MLGTKKLLIFCNTLIFLSGSLSAAAQTAPQTARQALLEMLFSTTPGTFEKHLPEATRAALRKAGTNSGASMLTGFSTLTGQFAARGQQFQTFDAGPTLMSFEDPQTRSKFEITVEREDLRGSEDEIELAFHGTKDGQPQTAGAKFRLTLTMKQELGTWRLNDISVTVGVSLSDPEFLKAITTNMRPGLTARGPANSIQMSPATMNSAAMSPMNSMPVMTAANESAAISGVRTLNTAEVTYAASFPEHGFTCTLSDLGGMGSGNGPSEQQAMLIDPRLASGRKNGYVFAVSGCNGTPASKFNVTAIPADPSSGTRAFCSNESAVIRFSADGKANSCLTMGKPLP